LGISGARESLIKWKVLVKLRFRCKKESDE
jgi:hypothetical protein